jgi:hypothetical protein
MTDQVTAMSLATHNHLVLGETLDPAQRLDAAALFVGFEASSRPVKISRAGLTRHVGKRRL